MSLIDEIIREAMAKGEFADLPGHGKPLDLPDDSLTPETMRMAHKILRDNDLSPDWMLEGQELDAMRQTLVRELASTLNTFETMQAQITQYNRRAMTYNLRVPRGVTHKRLIDKKR